MTDEIAHAIQPHLKSHNTIAKTSGVLDPARFSIVLHSLLSPGPGAPVPPGQDLDQMVYLTTLVDQAFVVFDLRRMAQLILTTVLDVWVAGGDADQNDRVLEVASILLLWAPSGTSLHPWPLLATAETSESKIQEVLDVTKLQAHAQVLHKALRGARSQGETSQDKRQRVASQTLFRDWCEGTPQFQGDTKMNTT